MSKTREISIIWNADDIKAKAEEMETILTDDQVGDILDHLYENHDAEYGITLDSIEDAIDNYLDDLKSRG